MFLVKSFFQLYYILLYSMFLFFFTCMSEPEPMEICTSSMSLSGSEIPSSDVMVLEGHTSEVQLNNFPFYHLAIFDC